MAQSMPGVSSSIQKDIQSLSSRYIVLSELRLVDPLVRLMSVFSAVLHTWANRYDQDKQDYRSDKYRANDSLRTEERVPLPVREAIPACNRELVHIINKVRERTDIAEQTREDAAREVRELFWLIEVTFYRAFIANQKTAKTVAAVGALSSSPLPGSVSPRAPAPPMPPQTCTIPKPPAPKKPLPITKRDGNLIVVDFKTNYKPLRPAGKPHGEPEQCVI